MKQDSIRVSPLVLAGVEQHCFSDLTGEVGGFLVGVLGDDSVEISAAYPALAAAAGQAHVTFTHEVWADILPLVEADHPGESIVGWYHSHPGFGLFLSDYDAFIQENFFADPRQVALVIDPLAGEMGWFNWADGAVVELGRRSTTTPSARVSAPGHGAAAQETRSGMVSWRAFALPAVAVVALAFVGGYVLAQRSSSGVVAAPVTTATPTPSATPDPTVPGSDSTDELKAQVAALQAQLTALKSKQAVTIRYKARRGDTLWRLAEIVYGDGAQYTRIEAANPSIRERGLLAGSTVIIPVGGD